MAANLTTSDSQSLQHDVGVDGSIAKDHWLNRLLLDVEKKRSEVDLRQSLYGAADIAAKYCGLGSPPSPMPGHWQHGWKAAHRRLNAQYEMGELEPLSPNDFFWVARKDQEDCLKAEGLTHARAIGLPCVYTPRSHFPRQANSLLVMPAHSLDYTRHDWKFDEYADQIDSIRGAFDEVVACVHQSCFERGLWVDSFRKRNIPVVVGAHTSDPLTLYRLEAFLSSFGYVTTNSHGSHLAYGAFWGARVSIFGSYANMRPEDFSNTPLYQRFPELIRPAVDAINEDAMRVHYPNLFVDHPLDAKELQQWGAKELGDDCKLSPKQLRQAFKWTLSDRFSAKMSRLSKRITKALVPKRIRQRLEQKRDPELRKAKEFETDIARIGSVSGNEPACAIFQGKEFQFWDGPECADQIRLYFGEEAIRFHSTGSRPRIVEVGAGFGLATISFVQQHPEASVLACEPDPTKFAILKANCEVFELNNVELKNGGEDQCLGEWLQEPVALLRLDAKGREIQLLESCLAELANTSRVLVYYRGDFNEEQDLPRLLEILKSSGFRIHLRSLGAARQPFVHRPVTIGCDQRLLIFAFRENFGRFC